MIAATEHYALPAAVPTWAVFALAAAGVAAWVLVRRLRRWMPASRVRAALFALRVVVGFWALLGVAQAMMRVVVLATNWPLWPIALGGAVAVESLLSLYALERRTVPRRVGRPLAWCRVAICLLIVGMLAQPVLSIDLSRDYERFIAVVLDDSASMRVTENQLTPAEKLRLAEMLDDDAPRRIYRLEETARELSALRGDLTATADWLATLAERPDAAAEALADRRETMHEKLAAAVESVNGHLATLDEALSGRIELEKTPRASLMDAKAKLTVQVRDRLKEAADLTADRAAEKVAEHRDRLLNAVRRAAGGLGDLAPRIDALGYTLDEAHYGLLDVSERTIVDAAAGQDRLTIARKALSRRGRPDAEGERDDALIEQILKTHGVRAYRFAASPAETGLRELLGDPAVRSRTKPATSGPTTRPVELQQTDLAGALQKLVTEFGPDRLAGVLVLTDGLHNARRGVEPVARQLAERGTPICSVVVGARRPPVDAAVVAIDAPETLYAKDKSFITVDLKLDGLRGKDVRVTLSEGSRELDFTTVAVPAETFRTRVQLADKPDKPGLHSYRVEVERFPDEAFTDNNEYPVTLNVTDERAKLLVIEARPRWEFRYLKNLFTGRDRTVHLQYVLTEPDRIADRPAPPPVVASAAAPPDRVEATELPQTEAEWMKFDAVLLGDVPPHQLGEQAMEWIAKFVADRGGALIVIAGPSHMPRRYADTPLADVLPVAFQAAADGYAESPDRSYRLRLTDEGRQSVLMQQSVDPAESLRIWNRMPDLYWRYPVAEAKPGARVLAFAAGPEPPEYLSPPAAEAKLSDAQLAERRRQREQYERRNALVVTQHVGLGQVLMLSFDRTWRLRYREGDTFHHKFWGQVLRWATAGKLPAGTTLVKLGADQSRYAPGEPVRVRAKIVRPDFSPVISQDVAARVYRGETLVLRKRLDYVPDSPGLYTADLGDLPGGSYRVELDAPPARPILAGEGVDRVSTEFSVDPSAPAELIELTADRGLPTRLADMTGGTVVGPTEARRTLEHFGPGVGERRNVREIPLWDSWPLLILIVALATGEWVIRKKAGLA